MQIRDWRISADAQHRRTIVDKAGNTIAIIIDETAIPEIERVICEDLDHDDDF